MRMASSSSSATVTSPPSSRIIPINILGEDGQNSKSARGEDGGPCNGANSPGGEKQKNSQKGDGGKGGAISPIEEGTKKGAVELRKKSEEEKDGSEVNGRKEEEEEEKGEKAKGTAANKKGREEGGRDGDIHIQEIGEPEKRREIRQRSGSGQKGKGVTDEDEDGDPRKQRRQSDANKASSPSPSSPSRQSPEKKGKGAGGTDLFERQSTFPPKVRLVPIKLHDGTMLHRDPDETMEVRTEFTNYCHTQFDNGGDSAAGDGKKSPSSTKEINSKTTTKTTTTKTTKERIVPITLDNGENFVPTFSKLDDIELPEWSAFNPKNRPARNNGEEDGEPPKEKFVKINLEGSENKAEEVPTMRVKKPTNGKTTERITSITTTTTSSATSSRESSPIRAAKKTQRQSRERLTKSHEKRVQHTVRFLDEEEGGGEQGGKRSSSLDGGSSKSGGGTSRKSNLASPMKKPARERHRSGPASQQPQQSPTSPERALHEIDRDINKIWRELQELESLPSAATRPPLPTTATATATTSSTLGGIPRRGSPARVISSASTTATATPVKIRTFTTPAPSSVSVSSRSRLGV